MVEGEGGVARTSGATGFWTRGRDLTQMLAGPWGALRTHSDRRPEGPRGHLGRAGLQSPLQTKGGEAAQGCRMKEKCPPHPAASLVLTAEGP